MIDIPEDLDRNDNYLVVSIMDNWFSYCQKGDAIMLHFASKDPRHAVRALDIVCEWLFATYPWCKMLIATIQRRSVIKLAHLCGFREFARDDDVLAMMRAR